MAGLWFWRGHVVLYFAHSAPNLHSRAVIFLCGVQRQLCFVFFSLLPLKQSQAKQEQQGTFWPVLLAGGRFSCFFISGPQIKFPSPLCTDTNNQIANSLLLSTSLLHILCILCISGLFEAQLENERVEGGLPVKLALSNSQQVKGQTGRSLSLCSLLFPLLFPGLIAAVVLLQVHG